MNDLAWLIICGLATWRLCHLLMVEDGPWDVFVHVRNWAAPHSFWSQLIGCVYCLSIWVGVGVLVIYITPVRIALLIQAYSAIAILVESHVHTDA